MIVTRKFDCSKETWQEYKEEMYKETTSFYDILLSISIIALIVLISVILVLL